MPVYAAGSIFDLLNSEDRTSWKAKASIWLEGIYATVAITVVVFFALFLDDFRQAMLPTALDVSCEYISGLILVRHTQRVCSAFATTFHLPDLLTLDSIWFHSHPNNVQFNESFHKRVSVSYLQCMFIAGPVQL